MANIKKTIYIFCSATMFITSCYVSDNRNADEVYSLDSILHCLENDSISNDVISTCSNLSLTDTVILEYYVKGGSFSEFVRIEKLGLSKNEKPNGYWGFIMQKSDEFYGIMVKYDLLFIIPQDSIDHYYYLSDIERESNIVNIKKGKRPIYNYTMNSYKINGIMKGPNATLLNFKNPIEKSINKRRHPTGGGLLSKKDTIK